MTIKKSRQTDQHLGQIQTRMVGMQYVGGNIRPGEDVHLERDFKNQHDRNAIRVKNVGSIDAGFIPRAVTSWLAPLWDEGKIYLEGRIPADAQFSRRQRQHGCALELEIYLTSPGQSILTPNPSPTNDKEALHEMVRKAYEDIHHYTDPAVILAVHQQLNHLTQRNALPESLLLVSLFPPVAQALQRKQAAEHSNQIRDFIRGFNVMDGIHYRNLTIFPIQGNGKPKNKFDLLYQSMQSNTVEVEEVSDSGTVHELLVKNRGTIPLLIPEGEILSGAKQNRVINVSILVAAQSHSRIPVSCVERGRWNYKERNFKSTHYAHPKLRSKVLFSVRECREETGEARSDQAEVWDQVSHKLDEMQCQSPTDSLSDGYETSQAYVDDYRGHLILPEQAKGVIVCSGDRVIGVDYFGEDEHFKQSWERLSNAYFFDACFDPTTTHVTRKQTATKFIEALAGNIELCQKPLGLGTEFMIKGAKQTGTGVWYGGTLCHFSGFGVEE